jgi:hypothetical protein
VSFPLSGKFISKLAVVTEEADETVFGLELLLDTVIVPKVRLEKLLDVANELIQIFGSSLHAARSR